MPRPYAPEAKVTPFIGKAFLKMGVFGFPIADFKLKDTMRVAVMKMVMMIVMMSMMMIMMMARVLGPHRKQV